jgi:hypothetical protein
MISRRRALLYLVLVLVEAAGGGALLKLLGGLSLGGFRGGQGTGFHGGLTQVFLSFEVGFYFLFERNQSRVEVVEVAGHGEERQRFSALPNAAAQPKDTLKGKNLSAAACAAFRHRTSLTFTPCPELLPPTRSATR